MVSPAVVLAAVLAVAAATEVKQCPGESFKDLNENVKLEPCTKLPCRLKKGSNTHITISFTPETDIEDLTNSVHAEILKVFFPFVGVNGNSVCGKIFDESDKPVSCPLKAGVKYTYKDSFPVLPFYPTITTLVKWSLISNNKDVTCFEVPVRIS